MSQYLRFQWHNHMNIINEFKNFLSYGLMVDVTLACDGKSLKAHKMVLSACSSFFRSLLLENPCKHPIVILKDIKYTDLKAIIDYMYSGEVYVPEDQVYSLIKTAQTLMIKGLGEIESQDDHSDYQANNAAENQSNDEFEDQSSNISENQSNDESVGEHISDDQNKTLLLVNANDKFENQPNDEFENQSNNISVNQYNDDDPMVEALHISDDQNETLLMINANNESENQSNDELEDQSNNISENLSNDELEDQSNNISENQSNDELEDQSNNISENQSNDELEDQSNDISENLPNDELEDQSNNISENLYNDELEDQSNNISENQSNDESRVESLHISDDQNKTLHMINTNNKSENQCNDEPRVESLHISDDQNDTVSQRNLLNQNENLNSVLQPAFMERLTPKHEMLDGILCTLLEQDSIQKEELQDSTTNLGAQPYSANDVSEELSPSSTKIDKKTEQTHITKNLVVRVAKLGPSDAIVADAQQPSTSTSGQQPLRKSVKQSRQKNRISVRELHNLQQDEVTVVSDSKSVRDHGKVRRRSNGSVKDSKNNNCETKIYKCQMCHFKTVDLKCLKGHITSKHRKDRALKCNQCSFYTYTKHKLERHAKRHQENSCTFCAQKFNNKSHLRVHLKDVHKISPRQTLDKLVFKCEKCEFSASEEATLKKHVIEVHEKKVSP